MQSRVTELFKKKKNISEGISSGKNIDLLRSYTTGVLKSMYGRMSIVHTIPDEYLSFEDMIIVYCNIIYLFNFETSVVIEIKSTPFARSMKSLIMALAHFGGKINLNEYIKEIINERA